MKHQLLVDFIERSPVLDSGEIVAIARHAQEAVRDSQGLHDDSVHEEAGHSSQKQNEWGGKKCAAAEHNFLQMIAMNKKITADAP